MNPPFPERLPGQTGTIETYQPITVTIITDRPGTDEGENTEIIFLNRLLTEDEEKILESCKNEEEIYTLVKNIKILYEPVEYEADLRSY